MEHLPNMEKLGVQRYSTEKENVRDIRGGECKSYFLKIGLPIRVKF